ncbi:SLOG family protein [Aromatoleum buckelii]|uniref:DUF2493 domain-containing protein n=1 Tax=Aromatoleum buckelii TaxID=200254 RepID=A0ABX1N1Z7_9RHOO|nr:SLOG family protein [Aromatoleum buckelii]MCK0510242.1 DUF2493 domain-containing protein [Aromatoleum buckelii]
MRVIIAGSRNASQRDVLAALERCSWTGFATCIVCGGAKGADEHGAEWGKQQGLEVKNYPADWKKYGKRAGPVRNREMAENAEGLIAVWDGSSRGTANMIETAEQAGLRIFILRTDINGTKSVSATGRLEGQWEFAEERAAMMEFSAGIDRTVAERLAGRTARSLDDDAAMQ